ncbi:methylated-DNA--[protein]-cysteine S-methyltransferase [Candidatus Chlamydia sanziniae]|uniref:DNA methyltransferase n=1 Tax=Candidatus Chlamydia sanziniae TaxID=1806891 RepID=A0A1A9HWU1_9CHLA|nr:methylated-DNA--[protein]-cysteine S-methyltransferase [Candidatus Chlamydia sanziniae]ANH78396.1 DNA methyltransferase [Candidatus Chlamydia sanziniae]
MAENLLIPKLMKHSLSQACSQGLLVANTPPIQLIVHFHNNIIIKTQLTVAPVFSCLFLGPGAHKVMEEVVFWSSGYAEKKHTSLCSYLAKGLLSPKQREILNCIAEIPFGEQCTYAEIAKNTHTHPRAVGSACKHNPFLLFIPCHRVVRTCGSSSYVAGISIRNILINFENAF